MKALVLEEKGVLNIRDIEIDEELRENDVRIAMKTVGICGSDVHYYSHGRIGPFVVEEPMVLGHEASGVVIEKGAGVTELNVGDRVCMEPGIPRLDSRASRLGIYNLDPDVRFWATPPVHGCMRESVIHPAAFTFKLPEGLSFAEGAMVEPLAIGMQAATKAAIAPGDVALIIGAGTIGLMTAMAALAGGCSKLIVCDVKEPKLKIAESLGSVITVNPKNSDLDAVVRDLSGGWGVDIVFEASGSSAVAGEIFSHLRPGGRVVYIGMPTEAISLDIVAAQTKEARMDTVFRYANMYPRALDLMACGKIDLLPLITETFPFDESIKAYDYALDPKATSVKIQIELD